MKPIRLLRIAMYAALLFFLITVSSTVKAQLTLKFNTYTQKVGTTPVLGAKYLFTNVSPGLDCIITLTTLSGGAIVSNIDVTTFGSLDRFQPQITVPTAINTTSYATFNFQLIASGSYNNTTNTGTNVVPTEPIWFRAYDVDGSGEDNEVSEFVELDNRFTGNWVDNPSDLVPINVLPSGNNGYIISNSNINGTGISDTGRLSFNGFIYASTTSTWNITAGGITGSNIPDGAGDVDRLSSWSFTPEEVIPGIDFGDAPIGYNGTVAPIVPAFHVVPSVASNINVYLGSVKPDVDYDPSGNVAATTDDTNASPDDEDGFASPFFPKYAGSGAYSVSVNVTNTSGANAFLYGYIDFNGDGDFLDLNEKSNPVTVASNASLQTVTVTFPAGFAYAASSNSRYARFRIGSVQAEVSSANSEALSGEVEDYRFNTSIVLSGRVFDDANGLTDNIINGTGIGNPGGTQLYAVLVDANNVVVESVAVNTTTGTAGNYAFTSAGTNNAYSVILSRTAGVVGNAPPAPSLPAGWVNTGEGSTNPGDGTVNGSISIPAGIVDYTTLNFGIDAIPAGTDKTIAGGPNPGGTTRIPIPVSTFTGTDSEDGTYTVGLAGRTVTLDPLSTTGLLYYNGVQVNIAGQTFTNFDPTLVTYDPAGTGVTTGQFTYVVFDNAGQPSIANTVLVNFTELSISGTVHNDVDGGTISGPGVGTPASTTPIQQLYANLVLGGNIVGTTAIAANGTYTLSALNGVNPNTTGYSIVLSPTQGTTGSSATTLAAITTIPGQWVNTAEGLVATGDGTANGTIASFNTVITNITTADFSIEQLPTAGSGSNTAINRNGNQQVTVPANTFTNTTLSSDPAPGAVTSIRITALPTGVTSIVINGTIYDATNLAALTALIIPTDASGNPNVAITVNPTANGATVVSIPFVARDAAGRESTNTGTAVLTLSQITITGTIHNDVDGGNINGPGIGGPTSTTPIQQLYANLVLGGNIVGTTAVAANGTYTLDAANGVDPNTTGYSIVLSPTQGTTGSAATTLALLSTIPGQWVNTAEGTVMGGDGTPNGTITGINTTAVNVTTADFGIEQLPTAGAGVSTAVNSNGTTQVTVPATTFTNTTLSSDPAPGAVTGIRITALPSGATSMVINGITYNSGNIAALTALIIPTDASGNPTFTITVDPTAVGVTSVSIPFVARDAAGRESTNTGTAVLTLVDLFVSGIVYDDPNTTTAVDGTPTNVIGANTLYAVLLNGTTVVARKAVASDGTYSFSSADGLVSGSSYTIVVTNGNTAVVPALVGAVYNSETDGTVNGIIAINNITASITNQNFGIDQLPIANAATLGLQLNPGGANRVLVAASFFTGSDPEDGTYATNLNGRKVTLASGANGSVYYNGVIVPTGAGTTITNFNPALVTFDPVDGTTTSTFTYDVFDNADKPSPAATITIPFRLGITIAGSIWNDVNGNANNDATETAAIPAAMYANIVNASGTVLQSILVTGGVYTSGPVFADSSYTVVLTNTVQTPGNLLSASIMPAGWVATGVNPGATAGTANMANKTGILAVSTMGATTNIINRNFGIERIPLATSSTTVSQSNLNPYTQIVASTSFGGSDFDLGTVQNIRITAFPSNAQTLVVNGVTYTSTTFPPVGILIPAPLGVMPANVVAVKPNYGVRSVVIPYVTIDNASAPSAGATVTVPYFTILPVTGLQLTGIRNGNDVLLKWNTLTELNTSHFIIERSFDGRNFENMGTASAAGTSNTLKSYALTDRNILKDVIYYRVNLVDADGKRTVSNTIIVRLSSFSKSNRVFPNPVSEIIYVELAQAGKYTLTLYNAAGQQLSTRQVEAGSSILTTINRNNLPSGNYILKVLNATTKESDMFKLILE